MSVVQIEQDLAMCANKFPNLICRPIAAQFMGDELIALFDFEQGQNGLAINTEKHYRLVSSENLTDVELALYRSRPG